MATPKVIDFQSFTKPDERENLFVIKIQLKQEVITALVDNGSQRNLIFEQLVQKLGLSTIPHSKPYPLG